MPLISPFFQHFTFYWSPCIFFCLYITESRWEKQITKTNTCIFLVCFCRCTCRKVDEKVGVFFLSVFCTVLVGGQMIKTDKKRKMLSIRAHFRNFCNSTFKFWEFFIKNQDSFFSASVNVVISLRFISIASRTECPILISNPLLWLLLKFYPESTRSAW